MRVSGSFTSPNSSELKVNWSESKGGNDEQFRSYVERDVSRSRRRVMYSEHNYFTDAIKTARNLANIFPSSNVEVVSSNEPQERKAAEAA